MLHTYTFSFIIPPLLVQLFYSIRTPVCFAIYTRKRRAIKREAENK